MRSRGGVARMQAVTRVLELRCGDARGRRRVVARCVPRTGREMDRPALTTLTR